MSALAPENILTAAQAEERRRARRQRVLLAAKLVAQNAWVFIDGTVKDLSASGAKIYCERPDVVADHFRLLLIKDNTIQDAQVRWRRGHFLGVEFTGEAKPAPPRKF